MNSFLLCMFHCYFDVFVLCVYVCVRPCVFVCVSHWPDAPTTPSPSTTPPPVAILPVTTDPLDVKQADSAVTGQRGTVTPPPFHHFLFLIRTPVSDFSNSHQSYGVFFFRIWSLLPTFCYMFVLTSVLSCLHLGVLCLNFSCSVMLCVDIQLS